MSTAAIIAIKKKYREKVNRKACEIVAEVLVEVLDEINVNDQKITTAIKNEKDINILKTYLKAVAKQDIEELRSLIIRVNES
ncbi:hypothetical protein TR13x_09170 [Caloranaerobacter sp. TR13]|uniref:hypothetical protein n=1 Tax=Caloranaerobacter sp. TR13 TaxID=1302151 RepID=UPI0006DA49F1|nr:hypothetical protein [Caloranaerobacter sp. TR13]KPU26652.1 hypothetical protein TR13x_09170 [Caloranaerobacter sp. TR13]